MHGHGLLLELAAVVLLLAGALYVPASWLAWKRARAARAGRADDHISVPVDGTPRRLWSMVAAALALGAAAIHLVVTPAHLADDVSLGLAFLGAAATQVGLALGLIVSFERFRRPAIAISAAFVVVWALSRTAGLPVGPHPWLAEPAGLADVVATVFEVGLIALLSAPLERLRSASTGLRAEALSVASVPAVGIIGIITLIAIGSLMAAPSHTH
jgi:hypothetical protein